MIDAITIQKEKVYAFDLDIAKLKRLSDRNMLKCPYCGKIVKFKTGKKKSAYFSHLPNEDCGGKSTSPTYKTIYNDEKSADKPIRNPIKNFKSNICPTCSSDYSIEYIKGTGYVAKCKCNTEIKIPNQLCPKCGSRMYLRRNPKDSKLFWGCSKYPECKSTLELEIK